MKNEKSRAAFSLRHSFVSLEALLHIIIIISLSLSPSVSFSSHIIAAFFQPCTGTCCLVSSSSPTKAVRSPLHPWIMIMVHIMHFNFQPSPTARGSANNVLRLTLSGFSLNNPKEWSKWGSHPVNGVRHSLFTSRSLPVIDATRGPATISRWF